MKSLLFLYLIILWGCNYPESNEYKISSNQKIVSNTVNSNNNQEVYKVIRVKDGDTFILLIADKEQVVRFAHIDCPEKK